MKLTLGNGYGSLSCEVSAAKTLRVTDRVGASLRGDVVGYAVCRFLRRSRALAREYVRQSYDLRLEKRRSGRTGTRRFLAPAPLLELPGAWCAVRLSVTAAGVTVESVGLFPTLALAQDFRG